MKKAQALKFWKSVEESTETRKVISSYENKKGYAGKRTLQRFIQAHNGFRRALSAREISGKTGWSILYVEKIYSWWLSCFKPTPEVIETEISNHDCAAPPDVNVTLLKTWGIKTNVAAQILAAWRECHRYGGHDTCRLYQKLVEDLKNGIPLKVAKDLFGVEIESRRYGLKEGAELTDRCRLFRYWESKENYEAFMNDVRDIIKSPKP
jgi:hypothetical protein